ncbi:DUF3750 domain-containing protein [Ahrensia sp. R2A130]|uniref:DUF3750 domain-containing protein n=1 Tax=Ahrensia sp. R2A130 TaxID=744979 RepID=UPI0001E0E0C1|nr:DUF3750 domain-containing protein [Ahrensia sp. R2A130]EFL88921.1 putative signal peptide protein [Ahrensia sp. R2A130]
MKRILTFTFVFLIAIFIAPALLHIAVWTAGEKPTSWRTADWSSAGTLPRVLPERDAVIHVMSARTGGLKGALATHSWILLKKPGRQQFDRYDVVGWGRPVRKNAYAPDARWYSNPPRIDATISGPEAEKLIPKLEAAIGSYRYNEPGDYKIWPGPNSNTFVAHVLRAVPELEAVTTSTAVGRDFPSEGQWFTMNSSEGLRVSLAGYAGFAIGQRYGFELNFLGLVSGFHPADGIVKVPGFGNFHLWGDGPATT